MIGRRNRFRDVVLRQLDLFVRDHGPLLADCDERWVAYRQAAQEDAEERYGDYVDAVDLAREELEQLRDSYRASLDPAAVDEYTETFNRLARKRFPDLALELD